LGIIFALIRGWKTSQALNEMKKKGYVDVLKARKMPHKNKYLEYMAGWAVLIGLFGNALGFVIALGSRDDLLAGAGVAFGSTVAGILVALWLEINFSLIQNTTSLLLVDAEYASHSAIR
jgi:flagellar motor component MotA